MPSGQTCSWRFRRRGGWVLIPFRGFIAFRHTIVLVPECHRPDALRDGLNPLPRIHCLPAIDETPVARICLRVKVLIPFRGFIAFRQNLPAIIAIGPGPIRLNPLPRIHCLPARKHDWRQWDCSRQVLIPFRGFIAFRPAIGGWRGRMWWRWVLIPFRGFIAFRPV